MQALYCLAGFAICFAWVSPASTQVKMQGSFVASKTCPVLQSIKKGTNTGNVSVAVGNSYKLLGKNQEQASHYWIEVPEAAPKQRWVAADCGVVSAPSDTVRIPVTPKTKTNDPFYVLAMSWQPAFCEGLPKKVECRKQTAASYEATHFALHGLWPQPRREVFCGIDKALAEADDNHRWEQLPAPELSAETRAALDQVMPGTQSNLDRHEWIKHGSCYLNGEAEAYFRDSIRVMAAVNASPVQAFVATNVGKKIQTADLRAKFDEAFGKGAGQRIRVACKDDGARELIVEVTLGLKGSISSGIPVADLILASSPTDAGCPAGIIDPVGLQ
jgi:ribonuclease T2